MYFTTQSLFLTTLNTEISEYGAGATFGMKIGVGAKILGMTVFGQVTPFGSALVYGEMGVGAVLYAKLRFDGYLMNLAFPSRAEIGFYKFPLDLRSVFTQSIIYVRRSTTDTIFFSKRSPVNVFRLPHGNTGFFIYARHIFDLPTCLDYLKCHDISYILQKVAETETRSIPIDRFRRCYEYPI